ncbi:MAG: type I methionyl aminopeptidase [candidate division Zixibacteria bacterium]|nr:type I methionyl aminopeptidase [candidate division Zixibacteria bacterium]
MFELKSKREVELMREAGRIVAEVHVLMEENIKPGITTAELDTIAEKHIRNRGAEPAFKGYRMGNNTFPASICASIDDVVVHGIPSERKLQEGEIISIDVGTFIGGYYGDGAKTFAIGEIDDTKKKLMKITLQSLEAGIDKARAGNRLGDIGAAVQEIVEQNGFSVVRDMVGHGIGRKMHEDPQVYNFGTPGTGVVLKEGLVLAIEPMVNVGEYKINFKPDGWTTVTADGKPSAHFEHTVAITDNGPEILTLV